MANLGKLALFTAQHLPSPTTFSTQQSSFHSVGVELFSMLQHFWKCYRYLMRNISVSAIWLPVCNAKVTIEKNIILDCSLCIQIIGTKPATFIINTSQCRYVFRNDPHKKYKKEDYFKLQSMHILRILYTKLRLRVRKESTQLFNIHQPHKTKA